MPFRRRASKILSCRSNTRWKLTLLISAYWRLRRLSAATLSFSFSVSLFSPPFSPSRQCGGVPVDSLHGYGPHAGCCFLVRMPSKGQEEAAAPVKYAPLMPMTRPDTAALHGSRRDRDGWDLCPSQNIRARDFFSSLRRVQASCMQWEAYSKNKNKY